MIEVHRIKTGAVIESPSVSGKRFVLVPWDEVVSVAERLLEAALDGHEYSDEVAEMLARFVDNAEL